MPWSILQRYILVELLRVFLLALLAITGIMVMAGIVQQAAQEGLGPAQTLKLIPFLIPGTLPFTVPTTTLFAVAVVYGRLSADNELTAIKAAGIPITRAVWPSILLGGILSGSLYLLYDEFIPSTIHDLRSTFIKDIEEVIYGRLRRDLCFVDPRVDYRIHVVEVRGRRLMGATFQKHDKHGRIEILSQAREAELSVDLEKRVIYVQMLHGDMSKDGGQTSLSFERESIPVDMPPIGANRRVAARERTTSELLDRKAELRVQLQELLANPPKANLNVVPPQPGMPLLPQQAALVRYQGNLAMTEKEINEINTELALRPALSFGCLFFVLIGCPVAIWFHKRDYLSAFVACFLPIVVMYYPLLMFGINLGKEGRVDPTYFMWLGNGVIGFFGTFMLWRLFRR